MSGWFAVNEDLWGTVAGSQPPLFYFFDGFIDSGHIGATLIEALLKHSEPQLPGSSNMGLVHDYRACRPAMVFDRDRWASPEEPVLNLHLAHDAEGMPYLVMRSPEPDHRWRPFHDGLVGLIQRLGVSMLLVGYDMPMASPYTCPTPLAVHTTSPELRQQDPHWIDRLEAPASFSSYLEYHLGKFGISSYGAAAHVPRYLANVSFTQAATIILHRYTEMTKLALPADEPDLAAEANLMAIEADTHGGKTTRELLHQLEEQHDRYTEPAGEDLPSAGEITTAVERFLTQRNDGNQPLPKRE